MFALEVKEREMMSHQMASLKMYTAHCWPPASGARGRSEADVTGPYSQIRLPVEDVRGESPFKAGGLMETRAPRRQSLGGRLRGCAGKMPAS